MERRHLKEAQLHASYIFVGKETTDSTVEQSGLVWDLMVALWGNLQQVNDEGKDSLPKWQIIGRYLILRPDNLCFMCYGPVDTILQEIKFLKIISNFSILSNQDYYHLMVAFIMAESCCLWLGVQLKTSPNRF